MPESHEPDNQDPASLSKLSIGEVTKRNKKSLNITISQDLFEFLDKGVQEHEFASWSHGIELALARLKKEME